MDLDIVIDSVAPQPVVYHKIALQDVELCQHQNHTNAPGIAVCVCKGGGGLK